jgi:hypothetical protein
MSSEQFVVSGRISFRFQRSLKVINHGELEPFAGLTFGSYHIAERSCDHDESGRPSQEAGLFLQRNSEKMEQEAGELAERG